MDLEYPALIFWVALTKYHRLGGLDNENLFLTVPESGKSRVKALADSVSGEDPARAS